jgi:hypothetical protein
LNHLPVLRPTCRSDNAKARWLAGGLIAAIGLVHIWLISAGRFSHWPTRTAYYSMLADGFLDGHLSLPIRPDARLLAAPDPYDPRFNTALRLQDAALYSGKYYVYWGPLPALLMVPFRLVTRHGGNPIGDQYVFFVFVTGLVGISAGMILRARRRFFPDQPWWTVGFGIVVAGLVNPIPFLLANASIYQTAIVAGQVFLLSGIYCAWTALEVNSHGGGAWARPRLFLAGACWSMAIGCRISLVPAVLAVTCLLAWRLWADARRMRDNRKGPRTTPATSLAWLGAPLAAGAALFGTYNQQRFGSPFEFGARYVLAGQNMHAMVAGGTFARARYITANLVRYLLEAPVLQQRFPFICPYGTSAWGWFGIRAGKDFIVDSVAGMLWAAPVLGLAIVPFWVKLSRLYRRLRQQILDARLSSAFPEQIPPDKELQQDCVGQAAVHLLPARQPLLLLDWVAWALLISSIAGFVPSLMVAASTMRYLADATPPLAVLASFGMWMLNQDRTPARRSRHIRMLVILTAYSACIGVLLGVAGHYGRFVTDKFGAGR